MEKTKILCFSTFSLESVRNDGDSMLANPKLVLDNDAVTCGLPYNSPAEESHIDTTAPREQVTSTFPKIQLLAIGLSGEQWEIETFRRKLRTWPVFPGETQQHLDIKWENCTQTVEELLQPKGC